MRPKPLMPTLIIDISSKIKFDTGNCLKDFDLVSSLTIISKKPLKINIKFVFSSHEIHEITGFLQGFFFAFL